MSGRDFFEEIVSEPLKAPVRRCGKLRGADLALRWRQKRDA